MYPVHKELQQRGIIPWLDRDDYYYGRDSRTALRYGLLRSRHVVFFITPAMLNYTRGWCPMELAYSDLLQTNFNCSGGQLLNFELPLIFLDRNNPELPRTAWDALRDRGMCYHCSMGDEVSWAVDQIAAFLDREQELAMDIAKEIVPGHSAVANRPGLLERVTQFDPSPIP